MKKILLLMMLPIVSFGQEIQFENSAWSDIVKKAKSQNKMIYVDAYATWCGPCKAMAKNVFTDKGVGEFYNANFINAKIDMEKGEGIELAKKYNVAAFPTHLFVDGNGNLVHKRSGYMDANAFIELGKDANNPAKQFAEMVKKYNSGNRDEAFLLNLVDQATKSNDSNTPVYARAYFKTQKNLLTKENIFLILRTIKDPYAPEYGLLVKNEEEVAKITGEKEMSIILDIIPIDYFFERVNANETLEKNMALFDRIFNDTRPTRVKKYRQVYEIEVAKIKNDIPLAEKLTVEYVEGNFNNFGYDELNSYAWDFFEKVTDKEYLEKALKWSLRSVELSSNYYNNDTLANLYYKLGDSKNAKIYAVQAIKLGKEKGEDTTDTEVLLSKI